MLIPDFIFLCKNIHKETSKVAIDINHVYLLLLVTTSMNTNNRKRNFVDGLERNIVYRRQNR